MAQMPTIRRMPRSTAGDWPTKGPEVQMKDVPDEIPLAGGWVTSSVVRVGDTVRRPRSPNVAFVESLLAHLDHVGASSFSAFLGGTCSNESAGRVRHMRHSSDIVVEGTGASGAFCATDL